MTTRPRKSLVTGAMVAVSAALIVTTIAIAPSHGSEESSFEVFQPIWTENELSLSRVTTLTFNSGEAAIHAVLATCDSSHVMGDYGPQQRNAAFEVGLRAEVSFNSGKEPPLFGDTLRVVLRSTRPPADIGDHGYGKIVAATVKCILFNAARSPAIRFVALRVVGEAAFRKYGGVFSTARYRNGPVNRVFREPAAGDQ